MNGVMFITDLHLRAENTKTEPHLLKYQDELLQEIKRLAVEGSRKYSSMSIVFLGDLTDRSIKDSVMFASLCLYFKTLRNYAKLYFVIGNHENTYKLKNNLFWHLNYGNNVITPEKIKKIEPLFEVVDYFDIDATRIILNHHGKDIQVEVPNEVSNVVVASHNNLCHKDLLSLYQNKGVDTQEEYIHYIDMFGYLPETDKLRYVFKGHQHMLFGCYGIKEKWGDVNYDFTFYDLSSLGRPKSTEFLQPNKRDIPLLEVDGEEVSLVNNFVELYDHSELNLEAIEERHQKYVESKGIRELRNVSFSITNVIGELRNLYSLDTNKTVILENAIQGNPDTDVERYMDIINRIDV